jgi:predicted O-methyltransferase YrrM
MKLTKILAKTRDIPYISEDRKKELYDFVLNNKPKNILELGFAHGASTCVMAAALDEIGKGQIDAIDVYPAKKWQDDLISIEELSSSLGLKSYINIYREKRCYTWWIKKQLQNKAANTAWVNYDFIYIDGSHNWTIDSSAFFLCEKLLNNGGWILFDDLKYTYARVMQQYPERTHTAGVSHYTMSEDELNEPAVGLIFELLVRTHPHFGEFRYSQDNDWGWTRKVAESEAKTSIVTIQRSPYSFVADIAKVISFLRNLLRRKKS